MNTLVIDFFLRDPALRLKGLSLKALNHSNIWQSIYKDPDDGQFRIDSTYNVDGRTAKIDECFLIKILKELKTLVPFDKIKIKYYYHLTGEELMKRVS